jgi:hypothetical protein
MSETSIDTGVGRTLLRVEIGAGTWRTDVRGQ